MQNRLVGTLLEIAGGLSPEDLARLIDNTLLSPTITIEHAIRLVEETARHGFRCAMIPPGLVKRVRAYSEELGVRLCTVVGFPSGYSPAEAKLTEVQVVGTYVEEIDIVAPIWAAVEGDLDYVVSELSRLVGEARDMGVKTVKIIVEAPLLDDTTLLGLVEASAKAGADYVKTSTGVYSKGGDPATVMRLHEAARRYGLKVKAAGGIRTGLDALLAIAAGADRIGTSSAVKVLESYKNLLLG